MILQHHLSWQNQLLECHWLHTVLAAVGLATASGCCYQGLLRILLSMLTLSGSSAAVAKYYHKLLKESFASLQSTVLAEDVLRI